PFHATGTAPRLRRRTVGRHPSITSFPARPALDLQCRWHEEASMARAKAKTGRSRRRTAEAVYRVLDVVGTSTKSWEDAAVNAVETAAESLRDLRVAEVTKMDVRVEDGRVTAFRTRVQLSFKYES